MNAWPGGKVTAWPYDFVQDLLILGSD
jgi:hypothetical protein